MVEEVEKIRKEMKKEMEDLLGKSQTDLLSRIAVMLSGRDPERGKRVVINSDAMINGTPGTNEQAFQANPSSTLLGHEGLDEIENLKVEIPKQFADLYKQLEDKVKNADVSPGMDVRELSLVPDLELPPNFKMLEFEKFDGKSLPSAHLTMFCRKMMGHVDNEELLIHCFQDSLKGSAAKWYNKLNRSQIQSWRDLAKAFTDYFRKYAQRWRDVAMQVQPPLLEREVTPAFVRTLKAPFLKYLVGNATKSFEDLVISAGARVTAQLMYNLVLSPSMEWSGHPDYCVYPEDSNDTHVTTHHLQPSLVSLSGVEWSGHHLQPSHVSFGGMEWTPSKTKSCLLEVEVEWKPPTSILFL
ncbi:hypothetical protein GQ457_15G016750 [Hibiscus cannabinus]